MDKQIPSIRELFSESWDAFKGSLGNVFVLYLLGSISGFVFMAFIFFVVAGAGFMATFTEVANSQMMLAEKLQTFFTAERLAQTGIVFGLLALIAMIWGSVIRIAVIAAIGGYKERIGLGKTLSIGFSTLIPVLIMSFVTFLITTGAWFALIIPGILIGMFLQYTSYEIVLGGKRWWGAVKGSVQIMTQNFGEVLLRMIILFLGVMVVFYLPMYLISMWAGGGAETQSAEALSVLMILSPIRLIMGILIGFFAMAYSVVTYKHAKQVTNDVPPSIAWMIIVSIVGWVIGYFLLTLAMKFYTSPFVTDQVASVKQEIKAETEVLTETQRIAKWRDGMSPEVKTLFEMSQASFTEIKEKSKLANGVSEVKKINDKNIEYLLKAIELDPNNPELWSALSDAYTWISTSGSMEKSLDAAKKAEELDPEAWGYKYGTGNVLQLLNKHDEAILKYQQVIRMEENYGRAHISLGISYLAVGVYDLAKEELQKGIDILSKYNAEGQFDVEILNARKKIGEID